MIELKKLLENKSISELDDVLEKFREKTNWTDWYMSGGCYTFADALDAYLGGRNKFWSVGEDGSDTMVHVTILYKGKYCDYNGCRSKSDVESDVSVKGKPKWFEVQRSDIMGEYNWDKNEVKKIINQLKEISK